MLSFCSSLRKRPEWNLIPARLLASNQPKWTEKTLQTHDISIPLPNQHQPSQQESFLMILLSSSDLQPLGAANDRIKRLYHSTGGRYVGVIFLLNERSPEGNGTFDCMKLQTSILSSNLDVPILPLFNIESLQQTLLTFQSHLTITREAQVSAPKLNPVIALLPYCSTKPPIPEHSRNILSEVYQNVSHLAQEATTKDGQQKVLDWLPNTGEAEDILGFWEQEFVVE